MLKRIFLISAVIWTGGILHLCLQNAKNIPLVNIPNFDKLVHTCLHFGYTLLWFLYFNKKYNSSNNNLLLIAIVISSFFFGIIIELIQQYFTTTRTADLMDILANTVGAIIASLSIIFVNKYIWSKHKM